MTNRKREQLAQDQPEILLHHALAGQRQQMPAHTPAVFRPDRLDQPVVRRIEDGLGGELWVHGAPKRRKIDHANVVQIGQQHTIPLHKGEAPQIAPRHEHPVADLQDIQHLVGHIAHVDNPMIGKEAHMLKRRRHKLRILDQTVQRGLLVDHSVKVIFNVVADARRNPPFQVVSHRWFSPLLLDSKSAQSVRAAFYLRQIWRHSPPI